MVSCVCSVFIFIVFLYLFFHPSRSPFACPSPPGFSALPRPSFIINFLAILSSRSCSSLLPLFSYHFAFSKHVGFLFHPFLLFFFVFFLLFLAFGNRKLMSQLWTSSSHGRDVKAHRQGDPACYAVLFWFLLAVVLVAQGRSWKMHASKNKFETVSFVGLG